MWAFKAVHGRVLHSVTRLSRQVPCLWQLYERQPSKNYNNMN